MAEKVQSCIWSLIYLACGLNLLHQEFNLLGHYIMEFVVFLGGKDICDSSWWCGKAHIQTPWSNNPGSATERNTGHDCFKLIGVLAILFMLNPILVTIDSSSLEKNRHHGLGTLNRMSHRTCK
ncbi:unnamed protein product [Prunus armeniaca]